MHSIMAHGDTIADTDGIERAIVCKCICPGATSLKEFTTPINGRRICSSLYPSAFKRERCGACSTPAFTLSEFMIFLLMKPKARRLCLALKNFFRVSLPRSATLADLRPLVRGHSPYESAGKDSLMCEHNVNLSSSDSHCSLLSRLFSLVKILCLLPAHLCS